MTEDQNNTTSKPSPGLDWRVCKELLPIPNSDRRKHADLFGRLERSCDLKNDEEFYSLLVAKIRSDAGFLERLDARFWNSKQKKKNTKSFRYRALKWLDKRSGTSETNYFAAPDDLFEPFTAEREVHLLLKRLFGLLGEVGDDALAPQVVSDPAVLERDDAWCWESTRDRLVQLVKGLRTADPVAAQEIVAVAEDLNRLCEESDLLEREAQAGADQDRCAIQRVLSDASGRSKDVSQLLTALPLLDPETLRKMGQSIGELESARLTPWRRWRTTLARWRWKATSRERYKRQSCAR